MEIEDIEGGRDVERERDVKRERDVERVREDRACTNIHRYPESLSSLS